MKISSGLKVFAAVALLASSGVASAQVRLTPIERSDGGSLTGASGLAKVASTGCKTKKKKKSGLGKLLRGISDTGVARMVGNDIGDGGTSGYVAANIADSTVDAAAQAADAADAKITSSNC